MRRFTLIRLFIIIAGVWLAVSPMAEAVRYPDLRRNGTEWFYVFGPQGNACYGAQAETKLFVVEVPAQQGGSVTITVWDADANGRFDEMAAGSWDTSTKFSVFSGAQLLDAYTVDATAADGTRVRFGPYQVTQGESQGALSVFRIEVEGVSGDDNNLFAFDLEPAAADLSSPSPTVRLPAHEGDRMRFYPAVPAGTAMIRAWNYDLDPAGGTSRLRPSKHAWRSYHVKSSGSAAWASTDVPVRPESTGKRWTYETTKWTQPRGNMGMRFEDQHGCALPVYCTPGDVTRVTCGQAPVAVVPSPQPVMACNRFEFDASPSYDPDNQQLAYHWDFGDGATGDQIRMRHAYERPGQYHVVLKVTDSSTAACRESQKAQDLQVNGAPKAALEAPTTACTGSTVHLSAEQSSSALGGPLAYRWDLGDGSAAEGADITHAYTKGGTYQIRVTVDDRLGTSCSVAQATAAIRVNTQPSARANESVIVCSKNPLAPLDVTFDASRSADADGNALSYHWDFGDGSRGDGAKVTHTYQRGGHYTAQVLVDDGSNAGCSNAMAQVPVVLNRAPIVVATQDVTTCAGNAIAFDASVSADPDGDALTYTWDFGDGTAATGAKVDHRYARGGAYHVTVQADDGSGMECAIVTASLTARVNTAPRAVANVDELGCVGRGLAFDAASSSDPDGQPLRYQWDFGDGTTAQGARADHVYQRGGSYPITLTVDDGSGTPCSLTLVKGQVHVNTPPVASAGPHLVCCWNDENAFDASQSHDDDGDALTYRWEFGDGATADGARVQHAYAKNGHYQVRVTVNDNSGSACGVATSGFLANVNAPPVAEMAIRGDTGRTISATAGEQRSP